MNTRTAVPGDMVRLKSGGPLMTVKYVEGPLVACQWFGDDDHIGEALFPAPGLDIHVLDEAADAVEAEVAE